MYVNIRAVLVILNNNTWLYIVNTHTHTHTHWTILIKDTHRAVVFAIMTKEMQMDVSVCALAFASLLMFVALSCYYHCCSCYCHSDNQQKHWFGQRMVMGMQTH